MCSAQAHVCFTPNSDRESGHQLAVSEASAWGGVPHHTGVDAEVVHLSAEGVADFAALHSRTADEKAVVCAFDLLVAGDDIRSEPLIERKKGYGGCFVGRTVEFNTSNTPKATAARCSRLSASSVLKASSQRSLMRPTSRDHPGVVENQESESASSYPRR